MDRRSLSKGKKGLLEELIFQIKLKLHIKHFQEPNTLIWIHKKCLNNIENSSGVQTLEQSVNVSAD